MKSKQHILLYRYDTSMQWTVAGVYPSEASALAAVERYKALIPHKTTFLIT